jgi:DNA polymerase-3 subunit epsilon
MLQIGVLAPSGKVLLDALVTTTRVIPHEVTRIHGITNADVADALPFPIVFTALERLIYPINREHGKQVVIYNADFDTRVLMQACQRYDLPALLFFMTDLAPLNRARYVCAMRQYAAFVGDWSEHFGNYRYQKLPGGTHTAIDDCRQVLALMHLMAKTPTSSEDMQHIGPESAPPAAAQVADSDYPF